MDGSPTVWANEGIENMVAWPPGAPLTHTSILAGDMDAQLTTIANAIDVLPTLTWIRLWPEMNGNWSSGCMESVADDSMGFANTGEFIDCWQYIVTTMRALTTKARFIFNVNQNDVPHANTPFEYYYPGDAYVDALAFDAYNLGKDGLGSVWQTHEEIYRHVYERLKVLSSSLPIWICETASKEPLESDSQDFHTYEPILVGSGASPVDPAHSKGDWVRALMNDTSYARITHINWFSIWKERDFRIDSSADSLAAFMEGFAPVAAGERVVLDPTEMSTNSQFDITALIGAAGPDWGDASIQQYLAEAGVEGQVPVDFTIPNRTINVPLTLQERNGLPFHTARIMLQQKAARYMEEGGWIKRHTQYGDVFAEVINAQLKLGGSTAQAMYDVDPDATLTLTTLPPWLGAEIDLGTQTGTGDLSMVISEVPVLGDHPGRVRIITTDKSGFDQKGAIWAFRARNYTSDATNRIAYEAEDLTPMGLASVQSPIGLSSPASGGKVVRYSGLPQSTDPYNPVWQPVLSTQFDMGQDLTHVGTYRVWARVYVTGSTTSTVRARLSWEIGDLLLGASNPATEVIPYNSFYLLDLGVVRIDKAPIGHHRWQGHIEAMSQAAASDNIAIDKIFIVPVTEGQGVLRSLDPSVAADDCVVYQLSTAEFRSDGNWRLSRSGTGYGPVKRTEGTLPRIPVSGMEGRQVELFMKLSRGTLDTSTADSGIDPFDTQVLYQPSYLFVGDQ